MSDEKAQLLSGVMELLTLADTLGEVDAGVYLDRARVSLQEAMGTPEQAGASESMFN